MAIHIDGDIRRVDQSEFGRISYSVMEQAFAVHNELGRFFCEDVYRDALASRLAVARTEVRGDVCFEDFRKSYFLDLVVEDAAIFEAKTVRKLGPPQRSQLLNYLLLTDLAHGKLINFRSRLVKHEFVNTHLRLADRISFGVEDRDSREPGEGNRPLRLWVLALLREIGAGLRVHLYESAVAHFFGGDDAVLTDVPVFDNEKVLPGFAYVGFQDHEPLIPQLGLG